MFLIFRIKIMRTQYLGTMTIFYITKYIILQRKCIPNTMYVSITWGIMICKIISFKPFS